MKNLNKKVKDSDIAEKELRISDAIPSCDICSGDGWLYHSNGGQSGYMKDCPACNDNVIILSIEEI